MSTAHPGRTFASLPDPMKILYLHGLYSKPGGVKPTFLRGLGHEVINPALFDDDFDRSVRVAREALETGQLDVIVGSSRGGAVAMAIESGSVPLVLIAPAWRRWGTATTVKAGTIILHAAADEVIPLADSRELLRASGLPETALIVVGRDHDMIDEEAFRALRRVVEAAGAGR
jgi:hypothetical protein